MKILPLVTTGITPLIKLILMFVLSYLVSRKAGVWTASTVFWLLLVAEAVAWKVRVIEHRINRIDDWIKFYLKEHQ